MIPKDLSPARLKPFVIMAEALFGADFDDRDEFYYSMR